MLLYDFVYSTCRCPFRVIYWGDSCLVIPTFSTAGATGLMAIIAFAITGMLFVIPTAAEIPIIQTFMSFGLGAGPAAALLITLPAISLPSLILVAKSFPKKVLFFCGWFCSHFRCFKWNSWNVYPFIKVAGSLKLGCLFF